MGPTETVDEIQDTACFFEVLVGIGTGGAIGWAEVVDENMEVDAVACVVRSLEGSQATAEGVDAVVCEDLDDEREARIMVRA